MGITLLALEDGLNIVAKGRISELGLSRGLAPIVYWWKACCNWSAKKRAALFARSKRSETVLQTAEVENTVQRGAQEAGATERGGQGSRSCSLR